MCNYHVRLAKENRPYRSTAREKKRARIGRDQEAINEQKLIRHPEVRKRLQIEAGDAEKNAKEAELKRAEAEALRKTLREEEARRKAMKF
jgi:hypothetical protein